MATQALLLVACLLVGHDVMMTNPATAHGTSFTGGDLHTQTDRMTMTTMVSWAVGDAAGETATPGLPVNDSDPHPEDSDCGVIREAAFPVGQSPTLPDASPSSAMAVPMGAIDSATNHPGRPEARAPTQDPKTRRALLQIFRV